MPPVPGETLRKVTLNLFEADCRWFERRYGRGWSEKVRELLKKHRLHSQQAKEIAEQLGFEEVPHGQ